VLNTFGAWDGGVPKNSNDPSAAMPTILGVVLFGTLSRMLFAKLYLIALIRLPSLICAFTWASAPGVMFTVQRVATSTEYPLAGQERAGSGVATMYVPDTVPLGRTVETVVAELMTTEPLSPVVTIPSPVVTVPSPVVTIPSPVVTVPSPVTFDIGEDEDELEVELEAMLELEGELEVVLEEELEEILEELELEVKDELEDELEVGELEVDEERRG
jgi:hypothetical protein